MPKISIYTDGGCSGNPGPGAWAAIIIFATKKIEISGNALKTTNNRMELLAVINALKEIMNDESSSQKQIELYSDSQYVKKGITEWIHNWIKRGWINTAKNPVKNQDLWKELKALSDKLSISWHWVKAHANNPLNEQCDKIVKWEIKKIKSSKNIRDNLCYS